MHRTRKAKIVATLGPASSDRAMVRRLFDAGVDVFRMNFSHGTHDNHRDTLQAIRSVEGDVGRPIGALLDLQGPTLRVGRIRGGGVHLEAGQPLRLDLDPAEGDGTRAPLPHREILASLRPVPFVRP